MPRRISIGVTDLSFHRVTGSLIAHVLADMGFEVRSVYAPHEENFRRLKSGEIDLLASAWLPSSHGGYMAVVEQSVPLIELGLHYMPYALWGVPDYVPMDDVREVSDLRKPGVRARMNPTIQGINPGSGISRFSMRMMSTYRLSDSGYEFRTGSEEECYGAFEQAVRNEEWVVVPLWKPQFLHHGYRIRELKEPRGLLGLVDRAVLLLREDRQPLFTHEELETLESLRFSNEVIAELDWQVSREHRPLDDATRSWLAERAQA